MPRRSGASRRNAILKSIIVDNSGCGAVRRHQAALAGVRTIEEPHNVGFGAAINHAFRESRAPYLATLNDDAAPHPQWLTALVSALEARPDAGMCASQVRLFGEDLLDSAGMLICGDGSSKQRGQARPPKFFPVTRRSAVAQRIGGSLPPRHARSNRSVRRKVFPVLRRYRPGPARPLGRLALSLRPRSRGRASLFAFRRARLAA